MGSSARQVSAPPPKLIPIDENLVARARERDMKARAQLYELHVDGLFRHLRYLTGEADVAEELVQETFVQALLNLRRYRGEGRFSTWLHGIGINVVRSYWRSRRSKARALDRLADACAVEARAGESPDGDVLKRQRVQALYAAIDTLPARLREAFVLRDIEGLSPAEGAALVGVTVTNFKVRASRARARVHEALVEQGLVAPKKEQTS